MLQEICPSLVTPIFQRNGKLFEGSLGLGSAASEHHSLAAGAQAERFGLSWEEPVGQ